MFRIYPAVDIRGGRCVRLWRGEFGRETVFSDRPWEMALRWQEEGTSYLHVVDLDGALQGRPVNTDAVGRILRRVSIPVQVGGGVRSREDVERWLEMGASRVILGTRALTDLTFLREAVQAYGERILVSLDTRGDRLSVGGWTRELSRSLEALLEDLLSCGVRRVVHTDIGRDGTLSGHEGRLPAQLLDRGLGIIAAGGISTREDLVRLKQMVSRGVEGAVVGRALYEGTLTLSEALELEE